MGTVKVSIWNVTWRNERPRFTPGPVLRALGYRGEDLRHPGGQWFTLAETAAWAEAKKAEVAERRQARAEGRRLPRLRRTPGATVEDLFEQWFRSPKFTGGLKQGKREERGLSQKTIADYRAKARNLCAFDPEFAGSPPAAVSGVVAQGIYEDIWEAKGLYMARGLAAVASSCWSWARRRRVAGITTNPWQEVAKQMPEPRVVVLEPEEITAWVAACDAPDADGICRPELGDAILIGLFTGQRQGDRLSLRDLGRDDRGRRLFRQSKTGAIVAIPETPQLRARLEAAAERRKAAGIVDSHVVLDERRRMAFKGDHYRHLLSERRAIAIAACPSLAGKRDQDLRDTAVTWLARAGCTAFEIASITGHSLPSIQQVLRHYLALHPEMADSAIGKMVAWMGEHAIAV